MYKLLNILLLIIISVFFMSAYTYYTSSKNFEIKDFNRKNINQIINNKTSNLPILNNDTNNVIQFNDGFSDEIDNDKPRSFWNLLKNDQ